MMLGSATLNPTYKLGLFVLSLSKHERAQCQFDFAVLPTEVLILGIHALISSARSVMTAKLLS